MLKVFCLDRTGISPDINVTEEDSDMGAQNSNQLVCHVCNRLITSRDQRISVLGRQVYSKVNPAGFAYHFVCYSNAPGCIVAGEPCLEHSWFSGYAWQVASCQQCLEHLGWYFTGETRFYGLIKGRVVEQQTD